jgi:hypothetical protein
MNNAKKSLYQCRLECYLKNLKTSKEESKDNTLDTIEIKNIEDLTINLKNYPSVDDENFSKNILTEYKHFDTHNQNTSDLLKKLIESCKKTPCDLLQIKFANKTALIQEKSKLTKHITDYIYSTYLELAENKLIIPNNYDWGFFLKFFFLPRIKICKTKILIVQKFTFLSFL